MTKVAIIHQEDVSTYMKSINKRIAFVIVMK